MSVDVPEWRYCAECDQEQLFEVPVCVDGHGGDCPDIACTSCGSAMTFAGRAVEVPAAVREAAA